MQSVSSVGRRLAFRLSSVSLSFSPLARYPCQPKYVGKDAMLCVCNATYCDTMDPVVFPPVGHYLKYQTTKAGLRLEPGQGRFQLQPTKTGWPPSLAGQNHPQNLPLLPPKQQPNGFPIFL